MKKLLLIILLLPGFLSGIPAHSGVAGKEAVVVTEKQHSENIPDEYLFSPRSENLHAIHSSPVVPVALPNLSNQAAYLICSQFLRLKIKAILVSQRSSEDHKSAKRYLFDNYPSHNFW